jgi:hypothetical protein
MNACPQWREELIDHALGQPPGAALQAHLATCAGCSEALVALRQKASQMDTGIQQLTAAEPRAQAPERVLAQIQQRSPGRLFDGKPFYGRIALAALVLTASLVVVLYRPPAPEKAVPFPVVALSALSTWRSPTESLLHSAGDPLLKRIPQLGEKFFETKPTGDQNAQ